MKLSKASRLLPAAGALACAAAVGGALYGQHQLNMQPCPWCILQRMLFILMAAWLALAALLPRSGLQRAWSALAALPAACGIAAALWQHFVAAKSASCALTLADRILTTTGLDVQFPEVFEVRANCSDAAVSVLGVPFEFWSLALFAILAALAIAHASGRESDA